MTEDKASQEGGVGIEIPSIYDGVLFWWFPQTRTWEAREGLEYLCKGCIDIILETVHILHERADRGGY